MTQNFNHVAMTVPPDALDEANRADIVAFYNEVFGWEEMPITVDRQQLVLQAHSFEQFVFLTAGDDKGVMQAGMFDHFGLSVDTPEELQEIHDRCAAYQEKDDRVEIRPPVIEDQHGVLDLHSFYVRYLLPMTVEVQYFDWKIDVDA